MDFIINLLFLASCIIFFIYYFWIGLLVFFPRRQMYSTKEYENPSGYYFFLLIPCLNEDKVIGRTIEHILSLHMANVMVLAIDDDSMDGTWSTLCGIHHPNFMTIHRTMPEARRGKGTALNAGYNVIRQIVEKNRMDPTRVIVGVLDADTRIQPCLFACVARVMEMKSKIGMVQTRVAIRSRRTVLLCMQDLEFFTIINQMQNLRTYTQTVAAAGNGQFNRLSAMETLGDTPWNDCLLEDFNFSLRLLLKGWKTVLLQNVYVTQQGVSNCRKLIRQRARWAQGCVQCLSYAREIARSNCLKKRSKAELFSFLLLPWFTLFSSVTMLMLWVVILAAYLFGYCSLWLMLAAYSFWELLILLCIILLLTFLPGLIFAIFHHRNTRTPWAWAIAMGIFTPIYLILQIPAVLIAFFRQALGIQNWEKTEREPDDTD